MSVLPGNIRQLDDDEVGYKCEGHDDQPCPNKVEFKMAGEVDSFGVEWVYLCKPCHTITKETPPTPDNCDHCGREEILHPWRDFEEGSSGPVYHICTPCGKVQAERLAEAWGDDDDHVWVSEDPVYDEEE